MVLGQLIKILESTSPDKKVAVGFNSPHSYRGYYEDLAFEPAMDITVGEMLEAARVALGRTFNGYKGGSYTMTEHTECWLANYGEAGESIGPILLSYMLREYPQPK